MSKTAVFFCVARENLRPRHAVKFSMPCVCWGVKDFLLLAMRYEWPNGTQIAQIRQISADYISFCRSSLKGFGDFAFDVPSSKCCVARHTPKPAWVLRSLLCIFTFLCFCVFVFLCFCVFVKTSVRAYNIY